MFGARRYAKQFAIGALLVASACGNDETGGNNGAGAGAIQDTGGNLFQQDTAATDSGQAGSDGSGAPGEDTGAGTDTATTLLGVECQPNPFHLATTLRFRLSEAGPVDLSVFDTSGRRVSQLVNGRLEARDHEVTWNGSDGLGRKVSAGLYLVRLRTTQSEVTERVVLVR